MGYSTYILQSESTGKLYIGQFKDMSKRLDRQNRGGVPSTQHGRPWTRLYAKEFDSRSETVRLEGKLKGFKNLDRYT